MPKPYTADQRRKLAAELDAMGLTEAEEQAVIAAMESKRVYPSVRFSSFVRGTKNRVYLLGTVLAPMFLDITVENAQVTNLDYVSDY